MANSDEQMIALFGPEAEYSENKKGETIKFFDSESGNIQEGLITWVAAASTNAAGKYSAMSYVVWIENALFPTFVHPSDVITD